MNIFSQQIMEKIGKKSLTMKDEQQIITRPPVVVLLGHVDHGKTTLLDTIAGSDFAKREFGEITQSIRTYEVKTQFGKITFIDTPGHSYFSNLRGKGIKFADVVLLVVSATEGVREQTAEAIKLAKEAKLPIICVISKIDLREANSAVVKRQLAKLGILTEGAGGQVPVVEVSAVKQVGVDHLLETISILASLEDFKADLNSPAQGVVLESFLDKKAGPMAQVLVRNGVLKTGNNIKVDGTFGKIRAIFSQEDKPIKKAFPSQSVKILGLEKTIDAGSQFEESGVIEVNYKPQVLPRRVTIGERELTKKQFGIILKADSVGAKEAILANLPKDAILVDVGVGQITSSDVEKAEALGAKIFGFNVDLTPDAKGLLGQKKNIVFSSKLIYEIVEEIKKDVTSFQSRQEKVLGTAKVLKVFDLAGLKIAGCKILEGFLEIGGRVKILRGDKVVGQTQIVSMKKLAKTITRATAGNECGVGFATPVDFEIGDVLKLVS